jgi:hypothetical protein
MRRFAVVVASFAVAAVVLAPGVAGAAARHVDGAMSGPSSFQSPTCGGLTNIAGTGAFAARDFGVGTYAFNVCVTQTTSGFETDGTVTFTTRSGAKLRGTIGGVTPSGQNATYSVTVTGGSRRYRHAVGTLAMGPLAESNFTNCIAAGICTSWTDRGPLTGTLRRVRHR